MHSDLENEIINLLSLESPLSTSQIIHNLVPYINSKITKLYNENKIKLHLGLYVVSGFESLSYEGEADIMGLLK